jgi:oligosaccharyltransferase complex subunit delta (ribophorin II)
MPYSLSLTKKPEPLTLGATDTLKLTFQITESDEGKGVQPHQTFLRFYDKESGEEGIQPVRVTPGGKAKFELVRYTFAVAKNARLNRYVRI